MGSDISVSADRFAAAIDDIVRGIDEGTAKRMPGCVREACQEAKKVTKANAPARTGSYRAGFSYRVKSANGGRDVSGEVGNKDLPGLVHLLEKGHATIGGGRVQGYPHVSDGADAGFKALEDAVSDAIDEVLS